MSALDKPTKHEFDRDRCLVAKTFEEAQLPEILAIIEPLLTDSDRYKQRAGAEIFSGLLRGVHNVQIDHPVFTETLQGSKHWPQQHADELQLWTIAHLPAIYNQLKPDTINFWEEVFNVGLRYLSREKNVLTRSQQEIFTQRDPRRVEPIVKWIMDLPLEFQGDSAFASMSQRLYVSGELLMVSCSEQSLDIVYQCHRCHEKKN